MLQEFGFFLGGGGWTVCSRGLNLSQLYTSVNSVNTGELPAHCRPIFGGLLKGTSCAGGVLASPPAPEHTPPPHLMYVYMYVLLSHHPFPSLVRGEEGRRAGKPPSPLLLFMFARHFPTPPQPTVEKTAEVKRSKRSRSRENRQLLEPLSEIDQTKRRSSVWSIHRHTCPRV